MADAEIAQDASADATDASLASDASDAPGDGDVGCVSQPQADDPSRVITFVLTNTSKQPRFVVGISDNCRPFQVDDFDLFAPPPFSLSDTCEGVDAGATAGFATVAPGATYSFTWDGRYAVPYSTPYFCPDFGPCAVHTYSARRAAPSGTHSVSFVVDDDMPTFVPSIVGGVADAAAACTFSCASSVFGGLCDAGNVSPSTVTVSFELPDAGPLEVDVPIP